jgi:putative endonuclease
MVILRHFVPAGHSGAELLNLYLDSGSRPIARPTLPLSWSGLPRAVIPGASARERIRNPDTSLFVPYYVYLLASRKNGTLYLGVTRDLVRRVYEHKNKIVPGFTARYDVERLLWFECYDDPSRAIEREKEIKKWRRAWKVVLIEKANPEWRDIYPEIIV